MQASSWAWCRDVVSLGHNILRNFPVTPTPSIFPKVLPYKWGADPKSLVQPLNGVSADPASGKKKEHKDKLFGSGDRPVGWGSSTRRGGGRKLRARPRKFVFLGFRREESGTSREFCRDVPDPWGCSKSLCKESSCAFFVPYCCAFSHDVCHSGQPESLDVVAEAMLQLGHSHAVDADIESAIVNRVLDRDSTLNPVGHY